MNALGKVFLGVMSVLSRLKHDNRGVTAIEYGLIAALIAVVIIASVTLVGNYLAQVFTAIGNALSNALAT